MSAADLLRTRLALCERGRLERADSGAFHIGMTFLCDYCNDERVSVVRADSGRGGFLSVSVCADHVERAL